MILYHYEIIERGGIDMKKTLSMLLICAMTTSVLAGCGNNSSQETTPSETKAETEATETAETTQVPETTEATTAEEETEKKSTDTYSCQLYGTVTDAGQVISEMIIDFGDSKKVTNVDKDTFTVHAVASTKEFLEGTELESYGDYEIDRAIVKTEAKGQKLTIYFDQSEGATLAYTSGGRNYPATLTYTITQNKPITLTAADGTVLEESYTAEYTCDNTVIDEETAKFESVIVDGGINYQFYNAGSDIDKLVVWFHGNGEETFWNLTTM